MPVERVVKDGKPAYRWGEHGKAYTYVANNIQSRERARALAAKQGRAIKARGY